jgi:hypothetical protein
MAHGDGGGGRDAEHLYALYLTVDELSVPRQQLAFWEHCNRHQREEGWKGLHVTLCAFGARSTSDADVKKRHGQSLREVKGRIHAIRADKDTRYKLSSEQVSGLTWRLSSQGMLLVDLSGPSRTLRKICEITQEADLYGRNFADERKQKGSWLHMSLAKVDDASFIESCEAMGIDASMIPQPGHACCPLPEALKRVVSSIVWNVEVVRCNGTNGPKRINKVTESSPF